MLYSSIKIKMVIPSLEIKDAARHYHAEIYCSTVAFRSTCMRILSTSSGLTLGKMEESAPLQKSNVSPK